MADTIIWFVIAFLFCIPVLLFLMLKPGKLRIVRKRRKSAIQSADVHAFEAKNQSQMDGTTSYIDDTMSIFLDALSQFICDIADRNRREITSGEFKKDLSINMSTKKEVNLLFEFLSIFVHFCDKRSYLVMNTESRGVFMDALADSISKRLDQLISGAAKKEVKKFLISSTNETDNDLLDLLVKEKCRRDFIGVLNNCQSLYAQYALARDDGEVKGTLAWEFSKNLTEYLTGSSYTVNFLTSIYIRVQLGIRAINDLFNKFEENYLKAA